jgi:hypothetical protein
MPGCARHYHITGLTTHRRTSIESYRFLTRVIVLVRMLVPLEQLGANMLDAEAFPTAGRAAR